MFINLLNLLMQNVYKAQSQGSSRQFQLRANKGFVGSHYNDKLYIHVLNVELYIQVLYDKQNV